MRWLDGITDSRDMGLIGDGVGDGQGGLVCCNSWGCEESDMTEQLNNNIFFTHIILHIIYVIYFYILYIYKAM